VTVEAVITAVLGIALDDDVLKTVYENVNTCQIEPKDFVQ
jgi:hypothetical protein